MLELAPDASGTLAETPPLFDDGLPAHFGGRILAQALHAAGLTVERRLAPHALHATFVEAGRPCVRSTYDVDEVRDGRSFATRAIAVRQGGAVVLQAMVSFHVEEPGERWGLESDPVPLPRGVSGDRDQLASPLMRFDVRVPSGISVSGWPRHPFWIRSTEALGDDPRVHAAIIAYISDMGLAWTSRGRGPVGELDFRLASLDHALWLHAAARADEWLYFEAEPVVNVGARGLARGRLRTADGGLIASMTQEALLRPRPGGA
jgi:acyl-CoA thioesterase-2